MNSDPFEDPMYAAGYRAGYRMGKQNTLDDMENTNGELARLRELERRVQNWQPNVST